MVCNWPSNIVRLPLTWLHSTYDSERLPTRNTRSRHLQDRLSKRASRACKYLSLIMSLHLYLWAYSWHALIDLIHLFPSTLHLTPHILFLTAILHVHCFPVPSSASASYQRRHVKSNGLIHCQRQGTLCLACIAAGKRSTIFSRHMFTPSTQNCAQT